MNMQINDKEKIIILDKFDMEMARKALSIFLKPIYESCLKYEGFNDVRIIENGKVYLLGPSFIYFEEPCLYCGVYECLDCEDPDEKKLELGRNCGFLECYNSEHVFRYSDLELINDHASGMSRDDLAKKYGISKRQVKKTIEMEERYQKDLLSS